MSRGRILLACVVLSLMSVGCCGPMGCGPGCGIPSGCNDCDGIGYGDRVIPHRPLDGLRQLRKNMVCGAGCGEVYVDEWISTPPDCSDPCCDTDFVGGAVKARPGCWSPGLLLGSLYGGRNCDGNVSSQPCGCGDTGCDGGCEYADAGYTEMAAPAATFSGGSSCGCASNASPVGIRQVASRSVPAKDVMTRSAKAISSSSGRTRR
jgi:hypothetical protein